MNATAPTTVRAQEAAHFGKLAADWWDPKGSSAMLHRLNPVRLRYIREQLDHHWELDEHDRRPLAGKRAADVGCGAGLLCEPLARLGAEVIGIDAAPENIAAARIHAEGQGLAIDYRAGSIDMLGAQPFDLVTSLEVIEHVEDPAAFVRGLAGALKAGGLLILSTPNRTPVSRLAMITLGEGLGAIPRGTHDWDRFLTPDELRTHLEAAGLEVLDTEGLSFSPTRGFVLGDNLALNYFVTARRR
ncbi:bifunctional 2-polyprenyl-6-hydroxyphenol methylase/3-demethylubiquinol 3-O-methyltransferase UbiG [Sphingomonas sp. MAH-20]|uniref:Ubiquinone biosynthesis O-methyltransferase n=1 Tax=Sphingomonas horti TaxID=2682842 RepID=A0A6I4J2G0_9SPHN|nr:MULTISPECIES: bifunctional 2-polyprenyl-6-hydroxyphenol methylase/3-demethylubiquinol 3-O-methyltransferase UbiG [Sphingomonas]MBA2918594.1 bifunctional 2-polyprenyl-6-hydroxyphenol methylase/3-demethylubiquinol 3-O-methyltransferase UbiG [Sphingomonas sp. CGMCC 1.13658]MVO78625.1 bifunctional 2-polyprenyl-6-hydroxyphenol methylase/3-demethylubiquinol 3-O-methyltransferase UbiG [Sphingomonas horti]